MIAAVATGPDARARGAAWAEGNGERPTVVCLTPVLDEAWILERFLACAALWADHIIVADQGSTDGSREIALAHPKVTLVENASATYNEPERQRLLIEAARRISGPRLLVALDADEVLTANWRTSPEWETVLSAPPGTVICFRRVNVTDDLSRCWNVEWEFPWGYLDDGAAHRGLPIHSPRVPVPDGAPSILLADVRVLHYAASDWERYKSRHRWYQCWEALNHPERRPTALYREYHHMDGVRTVPLRDEWIRGYVECGIDMTSVRRDGSYRWDTELLALFAKHGARRFRRLDIWDVPWEAVGRRSGWPPEACPRDPRTALDRGVFAYLRRTQRMRHWPLVRLGDALLRLVGW